MANYWQKALNAVFYANPVKLQRLIDEGHLCPQLLKDTGLLSTPLPIWRIPQMWEDTLHDPKDWNKCCQVAIAAMLERVTKVKAILHEAYGIEYTPVDYQEYQSDLSIFEPDESPADILYVDDVNTYVGNGRRLIDVELYCAREQYDYARVKELLLQGANPNVPVPDDEGSLYAAIECDCSFYSIEIWPYIEDEQHEPVDAGIMYNLLRHTADEMMYQLIKKYDTTPPDQRTYRGYAGEKEIDNK